MGMLSEEKEALEDFIRSANNVYIYGYDWKRDDAVVEALRKYKTKAKIIVKNGEYNEELKTLPNVQLKEKENLSMGDTFYKIAFERRKPRYLEIVYTDCDLIAILDIERIPSLLKFYHHFEREWR